MSKKTLTEEEVLDKPCYLELHSCSEIEIDDNGNLVSDDDLTKQAIKHFPSYGNGHYLGNENGYYTVQPYPLKTIMAFLDSLNETIGEIKTLDGKVIGEFDTMMCDSLEDITENYNQL
jgi:hypothetical protein